MLWSNLLLSRLLSGFRGGASHGYALLCVPIADFTATLTSVKLCELPLLVTDPFVIVMLLPTLVEALAFIDAVELTKKHRLFPPTRYHLVVPTQGKGHCGHWLSVLPSSSYAGGSCVVWCSSFCCCCVLVLFFFILFQSSFAPSSFVEKY